MSAWQTKCLGDVLQLNYGKSLSVKNRVEGPIPVYGSNGVVGSHNEAIVDAPGLIVGRKGSAGQVHRSLGPFCPIDTTFYVTAADAPDVDLEFLFYLLRHIDLTRITGDVGVPGLNREMAYMEPVHFPAALPKQKKIAHILSTVQRAIEAQERIIQTTTELKKALMHKLFTEGLRNEPQKQTEIGPVPESWEVVRVDAVFEIQQGKQVSKKNRIGDNQHPFLRTKNVFWNRLDLTELDQMHFTETEIARLKLCPNDLLVCEGGAIGRTALWKNETRVCFYQNHLHRLRVRSAKVDQPFAVFWFWYAFEVKKLYFGRGNTTTIPNLSQSKLAELPMALPPKKEQREIADVLRSIENKTEISERKKTQLQDLFRTLLHELMTAKTRVHEIKFGKETVA